MEDGCDWIDLIGMYVRKVKEKGRRDCYDRLVRRALRCMRSQRRQYFYIMTDGGWAKGWLVEFLRA